jgi:predicted anti-sigma-YlaC factor YlaD
MTQANKTGIWRRLKGTVLKRMHRMITCEEFEGFILDYLDGELSRRQQSVFEWHIRICRECRDYLAAYQRATELGSEVLQAEDESVLQDVPEDLIKAILAAREQ